jgi:hypothetical protein
MNPNNNKNFNDEALRINRELKRENDALKLEIKSLWSDLSELEKLLAKYKETFTIDEIKEAWTSLANDGIISATDLVEELEQRLK